MTERLETHSVESEADEMDQRDETLASLGEANDQLMAKNHALAKALSRATQELTKAKAQPEPVGGTAHDLRHHGSRAFLSHGRTGGTACQRRGDFRKPSHDRAGCGECAGIQA